MSPCTPRDWQLYHTYENKTDTCFKHNLILVKVKVETSIKFDYQGNEISRHDYTPSVCPTWKENPNE